MSPVYCNNIQPTKGWFQGGIIIVGRQTSFARSFSILIMFPNRCLATALGLTLACYWLSMGSLFTWNDNWSTTMEIPNRRILPSLVCQYFFHDCTVRRESKGNPSLQSQRFLGKHSVMHRREKKRKHEKRSKCKIKESLPCIFYCEWEPFHIVSLRKLETDFLGQNLAANFSPEHWRRFPSSRFDYNQHDKCWWQELPNSSTFLKYWNDHAGKCSPYARS